MTFVIETAPVDVIVGVAVRSGMSTRSPPVGSVFVLQLFASFQLSVLAPPSHVMVGSIVSNVRPA